MSAQLKPRTEPHCTAPSALSASLCLAPGSSQNAALNATLVTYWDKIVITDPRWRPEPDWQVDGGMDHGKTNPTAVERMYVDFNGTLIFCGEFDRV